MTGVFVSYRRTPSTAWAVGIAGRLRRHFGRKRVFIDLSDIEGGADFPDKIAKELSAAEAFVAVVDPQWIRIDVRPHPRAGGDWMRRETAAALQRGIPVIPVLIDRAEMPNPAELPEDVRDLASRNAVEISPLDFESGVRRLIKALEQSGVSKSFARRIGPFGWTVIGGVVVVLGVLAVVRLTNTISESRLRSNATGEVVSVGAISWEITEVTNERYAACVEAQRCDKPGLSPPGDSYDTSGRERMPVVNVDAFDANTFCAWIGRRLPTYAEWHAVATNGGETDWPWGDERATGSRVVADVDIHPEIFEDLVPGRRRAISRLAREDNPTFDEVMDFVPPEADADDVKKMLRNWGSAEVLERQDGLADFFLDRTFAPADTEQVGDKGDGATSTGIFDLVGNAGEWSSTTLTDDDDLANTWDGRSSTDLVVAGGSFDDDPSGLMSDPPYGLSADQSDIWTGFRCVGDNEG